MTHKKRVNTLIITAADYFSAVLLLAVAAFCQYYHVTLLAVLSSVLAVMFGAHSQTLSVDTSRRRYRLGHRLFGFTFGPWQELPSAQRVVVKYFSDMDVSITDGGGLEHNKASRYIILLSIAGSQQADIITSTTHYKKALHIGCFLGATLGIEVVSFDQHKRPHVLQEAELY